MPTWDSMPRGAQLRMSAVAVLKSLGTLAEGRVYDSRLDPIQPEDGPAIVVTSTENRQTLSAAGGNAAFRVAYALRLQGFVTAAVEDDAVAQAETLRKQMLDGLLEDPVWPGLVEAIATAEDTIWTGRTDSQFERQTVITFSTAFRETYTPRLTSVLQQGGAPGTPRTVIGPLTRIRNTIQTSPTASFEVDVTLPPPDPNAPT